MDLPEIRTAVARYLDDRSLYAASLVCRSWNASISPVLYYEVRMMDHFDRPSKDAIRANADYIRSLELSLHKFSSEDQVALIENCTKIETIYIHNQTWTSQAWDWFSMLVQRNPNIESLCIFNDEGVPKEFINTLSSLMQLRELRIKALGLHSTSMELLFDTAVRLEILDIMSIDTFPSSFEKWLCFPNLKNLSLTLEPVRSQLELIRRCPKLDTLTCYIHESDPSLVHDICEVFRTTCPFIENLELRTGGSMSDEDLSRILDSLRRLTCLNIPESNFGEMAFRSLVRHPFLEKLHLKDAKNLSSKLIQQIMTSCPNLTEFSGTRLEACDIVGFVKGSEDADETDKGVTREEEEARKHPPPQDWVCTKLTYLYISIRGLEGKPREWHRRIFRQLGKLNQLRNLDIDSTISDGDERCRDGLDFRPEAGLDEMAGLKQLECLDIDGLWQDFEREDVEWMVKTWPKLRGLYAMAYKFHDHGHSNVLQSVGWR
ncbi:hypothetical protein B0O80DRAFT_463020 [Mortierella sp. GBAus27b]|nr:hypothetical protein BGX31_005773 [Mortierella sp. GBA43]KAI8348403.1 hypothetical protein B0O80DRAFT_463020 [Mortierella sp. GBAus27b]